MDPFNNYEFKKRSHDETFDNKEIEDILHKLNDAIVIADNLGNCVKNLRAIIKLYTNTEDKNAIELKLFNIEQNWEAANDLVNELREEYNNALNRAENNYYINCYQTQDLNKRNKY